MDFKEQIKESPKQYKQGFQLTKDLNSRPFERVIICGMGGSAFAPELLSTFLKIQYNYQKPIHINRQYDLPFETNENDLIILSSYSGNTEETISCAKQALTTKSQTIVITAGGELKQIATQHKLPLIELPAGLQPRCATGYFFSSLLQVFINIADVPKTAKDDVITAANALKPTDVKSLAKELAAKMKNKTTCFYSDQQMQTVAMACKIKINENAKAPAFYNQLPESNHNELNGFAQEKQARRFIAIFLAHNAMHAQTRKRINATSKLYTEKTTTCQTIELPGNTWIERALYALYLFDWATYYLAVKYKIDPEKVEMVEQLKKML